MATFSVGIFTWLLFLNFHVHTCDPAENIQLSFDFKIYFTLNLKARLISPCQTKCLDRVREKLIEINQDQGEERRASSFSIYWKLTCMFL